MILFDQALSIVLDAATRKTETESTAIENALGRILAQDIFSDMDMPPFNKSAMDGYACRMEDITNELEIIEVIPAGKSPQKNIGKNQCAKIMTGSMLPQGADCVIKIEDTQERGNNTICFIAEHTKKNYVPQAEDLKKGDRVLKKGTLLKAQHMAILAMAGQSKLQVFKKIKAGIISTGDELVEPDTLPSVSQIRNSNASQLIGQLYNMNVLPLYFGIAKDNEKHSHALITKALQEVDVLLLSGGVSMGDFDFIPKIFEQSGVKILFKEIAVQPGKPTVFGVKGEKFIFGLPGNPVSSFNIFELLAKPMIYKLMGHTYTPMLIKMPMAQSYSRKSSTRLSFVPVKIEKGKVWPTEYHGSAHINALTQAHGLIAVPVGTALLKQGDLVDVRQI